MNVVCKLLVTLVALGSALISGCAAVHRTVAIPGIQEQELNHLADGNLLAVRDSYESRAPELNDKELAILCDIYVKHISISKAQECLADLEKRPLGQSDPEAIEGKRALIAYLVGDFRTAAALSKHLDSSGGRYVYALAQIRLDNPQPAESLANEWMLSYDPPEVLLAANLLLATGQYDKVLEVLQDPERRLARDYNLSGGQDIFGNQIDPAPLKVDLFGEFGFGLLNTFSFAPRSNVYVEYALAKAELETGETDDALRRYDTILNEPGIDAYREIKWRSLSDKAQILAAAGNSQTAIELYKKAVEEIESARASITTDAGRIGFVGDKQSVYENLVELLLEAGDVETAFQYTERSRSRALVDLLASVEEFGARGDATREQTAAAIETYQRAEVDLYDAQVNTGVDQVAQRKLKLDESRRALSEPGRQLIAIDPQIRVNVVVTPIALDDVRQSLHPDEALISYYRTPNSWWAFVVMKRMGVVEVQLPTADFDSEVVAFRDELRKEDGNYDPLARSLYDKLFAPVEAAVPRGLPSRLTIVPHGVLHYLPFAALKAPDNTYLVARTTENYVISTLPSAQIRQFMIPGQGRRQGVLAVANPTREDTGEAADLEGAEAEAKFARGVNSKALIRDQATKENFLQSARNHDIIHIAGHGVFDVDQPIRSRLLLAPRAETGDLTVVDLLQVEPPWGARLTVLSACESSRNAVRAGQDMIGLQRGFLYAGTDSIVGSLWDIRDKPTLLLMEQFYQYIEAGRSGAAALRSAQRWGIKVLPGGDWAAFTYTGLHQ